MIIGIPKEILSDENRIGITPNTVKELVKKDFEILIESNAGLGSFISDSDYQSVGAKIISNAKDLYQSADMVVKVNPPSKEEVKLFKNDSMLLSFMQPTKELELVKLINNKNITGFSSLIAALKSPEASFASYGDKTFKPGIWEYHAE